MHFLSFYFHQSFDFFLTRGMSYSMVLAALFLNNILFSGIPRGFYLDTFKKCSDINFNQKMRGKNHNEKQQLK